MTTAAKPLDRLTRWLKRRSGWGRNLKLLLSYPLHQLQSQLPQRRLDDVDTVKTVGHGATAGMTKGVSVDEQRQSQNLRVITGIEFGK